ncbi:MAG: NAD-dependent epimerase/dehydratase family protein [Proteobacteria bacterium]|nr:NAD-dependent epimerase/dehydratase family protein [Cystobacterineae bacterium]MCL2258493.1 NAD-dependent epimerase/dehydratase family protein [Cystobacterineae bacterium]MCL2315167.1 NAD-dependent epimerase/dehydratase family protein [Pseudomonadota bacterium]
MNILVTGGTGFLGAHLIPLLTADGHRVRLLGRTLPSQALPEGVEFRQGDLKERALVRSALEDVDAIYHLAGRVSFRDKEARQMYELHVDCTREFIYDVAKLKKKPRFILMSTSGTIAVSKTECVLDEDAQYPLEVVGRWPYYLSKIYEEKLALELCPKYEIPLVVLNPSLLMGPGDERLSSTWTVAKFLQGDIPSIPNGGISIADVRDVAQVAFNALKKGELYGRHLLGLNFGMREFFERISRLSGVSMPMLRLPKVANIWGAKLLGKWAEWRGREPALDAQEVDIGEHWFWLDSKKAQRLLDYRPHDVYETLQDTIAFILQRMPPGHSLGTKGRLEKLRGD